ncbi:MAG: long-chain-fatty-acid--CoA ligase [Candidatus Dormibacter sp.]
METALTPMEFMRRSRRVYPNREAVVDGDRRLSYGQLFDRCDRGSAALQRLGVGPGDRVAYIAPNILPQLEAFYAVTQLGAVLVPINYRLTADDFAYIIDHSGAKVVCADADYLATVDSIRPRLTTVEHFIALRGTRDGWLDYEEMLQAHEPIFRPPSEINEQDLLTINYTSGTTARPKGVMITHRNAWINVVGTLIHLTLRPGDRYLWTLPMFHANGWSYVWAVTAAGATHVCLPKVEPSAVFRLVREERVGWMCAAPTVLIALANAPGQVRGEVRTGVRVVTAGATPAAATIERLEVDLGWEVTQVYGLTETSPFITICEPLPEHAGLRRDERSTIKARTGVELITSGDLRVFDEEGREVPHDGATLGEIVVRGNAVMAGYYRDPEATQKAIRDGWFHTGDAAVVHPDGYAEIRDRIKDVIISGGENISSIEVEGVLLRHPAVQEVAVVGMPHEKWGEAPHAFVVLKPGASADKEEICDFARSRLAHFKAPQWVSFVDELPKTATGKIQKYVLRKGAPAVVRQ